MLTPAGFRTLMLGLDDFVNSDMVENMDIEQGLELLVTLNLAKRDLASIYENLATKMTNRMEEQNISEVSLGSADLKKKTAAPRKTWDNVGLIEETYDRICQSATDMDTGEVMLSPKELTLKLLDYFNPSYWRVKELSKLGINADNYCEVGEEKTNIAIYLKGDTK